MDDALLMRLAPYQITYTARRRVSIRLLTDGAVRLSAPPRTSTEYILKFAVEHLDWIEKQRRKMQKMQTQRAEDIENTICYHGEKFTLVHDSTLLLGCRIDTESRTVFYAGKPEHAVQNVFRALRNESEPPIIQRVHTWSEKLGLADRLTSVRIYDAKTQWGNCTRAGRISMNWRLFMAPNAVLDYVIIHELFHLVHFDHSARFWGAVSRVDHDYEAHRQWLHEHQHFLMHSPF